MNESTRIRLSIVGVVVMALFSALFARLWFLQVAADSGAAEASTANRIRVIQEPAVRGRILDSKDRVLVGNRVTDAITFDRSAKLSPEERQAVIGRLAELFGVREKVIRDRIDDPTVDAYAPVPIALDVPMDKLVYVGEHKEEFPGVKAERLTTREYPNGRLAAHVLGYVGEINADELEALKGEGYQQGDLIGKAGVEQMFESQLRGEPHVQRLEVDAQGRVIRVLEDKPPVPGKDIRLTIDLDMQRIAEESLRQGMEGARGIRDVSEDGPNELFRAGAGSVTVLDPRDGSVVAMASAPDFDPAEFTNGIPSQTFEQFESAESNFPLLNRAVQGTYAPGSTWKLITGLAGLESGLITPEESLYDSGCVVIAEREFCNPGEKEHGSVNLPRALTVSSDVFFYELGRDMWQLYNDDNLDIGYATQRMAEEFGFGAPTGIGFAGEPAGRIPDQEFKEDFNRTNPNLEERRVGSLWLPGDSVNLAVGQGDLLVTPLQLANAYATFANGGTRFTPRMASAILEPRTGDEAAPAQVVQGLEAQPVEDVDLDPAVRDLVMLGLTGVTTSADGTADAAFSGFRGGSVAGKTGTAEGLGRQDTSLFVGISPADAPQYVTLAVIEEGGFGSSVAAPIVRRIIEGLAGNPDPVPVRVRPPSGDDED